MQPMYRKSIEDLGITEDYFNELPNNTSRRDAPHDWDWWHKICDRGDVKTYTQRYAHKPDILVASDPIKVAYLDARMTELISAARSRDIPKEKEILAELMDIAENLHYNRPWNPPRID